MVSLTKNLNPEDDAKYAKIYLAWIADLDRRKREQSVPDTIFHPDPIRKERLMCNMQVMHFTNGCVMKLFHYKKGMLYIR